MKLEFSMRAHLRKPLVDDSTEAFPIQAWPSYRWN